MKIIDLLPYIYRRFYHYETPTEASEIEAEKLLAKIIENDIDYDITNVKIDGKKYERTLEKESDYKNKVDNHMIKRYDICKKLGIKDHHDGRITNAVPASIILEKPIQDFELLVISKKLAFVYSVTNRGFDIDYNILEHICNYIYDYIYDYNKLEFVCKYIGIDAPQRITDDGSRSEEEFAALRNKSKKNKKKNNKKKNKSKIRKSKRRKSKRRKTRRNK